MPQPVSMKFRAYLRVPVPAHRKALTRILLASHALGIEMLRYRERLRLPVPRHKAMPPVPYGRGERGTATYHHHRNRNWSDLELCQPHLPLLELASDPTVTAISMPENS
jgi:hypothetical protein